MDIYHHPNELFDTFGVHFLRRGVINGLKSYITLDFSDWVIHSRYLLTQITNQHLKDLFDFQYMIPYGSDSDTAYAAAWISGLLKKERFFHEVETLAKQPCRDPFYAYSRYGSIMLYENAEAVRVLIELIEMGANDNCYHRDLALRFLFILDDRLGTNYAEPFIGSKAIIRHSRIYNYVSRFLLHSEFLRAGIQFKDTQEFRAKLHQLLNDTISPEKFNLLTHQKVSTFLSKESMEMQLLREVELKKARTQESYQKYRKPLTKMSPTITSFPFLETVKNYLLHISTIDQINQVEIHKLITSILSTTSHYDLLGGIDFDIYYQLPIDIIDMAYEKLRRLTSDSYHLQQEHAIVLLLRGNKYDEKAKNLYQDSQSKKDKYSICRYQLCDFHMTKGYKISTC